MNKYLAFFKDKKIEVESDTSYHAQLKAAEIFKAKKSYLVTVVLCEKNGETVTHSGDEFWRRNFMNKKIGNHTVKSDGRFRPLLSFYELSEKDQDILINEKAYCFSTPIIEKEKLENCTFFKYKNQIYNLDEFTRLNCKGGLIEICDAVLGFAYFSGIGIKFNEENDAVKVFYFYE